MPLAHVLLQGDIGPSHLLRLANFLRQEIASALNCDDPGGDLTDDDIEVNVRVRNPNQDFGSDKYEVQVTVWANDFPQRRADLQARCDQLNKRLGDYLSDGQTGYVWVLLSPAAFAEFGFLSEKVS